MAEPVENEKELPDIVVSALKQASDELLANNNEGSFFSVDHTDTPDGDDTWKSAYDNNALAKYSNFEVLGDEEDKLNGFDHLLKDAVHEDITGDGGVVKIIKDQGIGQVVPDNYIILIHYIAYISNLHEPFDVTYVQGRRPRRYTLGTGAFIPGLEIGIKTMRIGENARFIIQPKYAFREMGCPPRIPPNATVMFDIHLVSYLSPENSLSFDRENCGPQSFEKNLGHVKKLHVEGNEQFKIKNIDKAIGIYNRALEMLQITGTNSDEEEIDMMKYLNKLYTNLSLCYLKRCAFNKVCRMGSEAMKYSERFSKFNAKLFFNWGKALRLLKDFSASENKLKKALKLEPLNVTILDEILRLEKDKEFNSHVKHFTFDGNQNNADERFPFAFWQLFDTKLTEFIESDDDMLTVTLNKCPADIQLAKNKAISLNLQCHMVTKAGVETNCMAIKKQQN